MTNKTKVVLVQLGSPKSPSVKDVRAYLREFLGDPRVVDINPFVWKIILNFFVLPFRPKRSGQLYSRIWDGENFPLITYTEEFAKKVSTHLDPEHFEVDHAFLLSSPRIGEVWDNWEKDVREGNNPATELLAVALFPQYSESTVASGMDAFARELGKRVLIPPFRFLTDFHRSRAFIDNSFLIIREKLDEFQGSGEVDALVISFHGIPKRRVIEKEDPYYLHCYETFLLISRKLKEENCFDVDKMHITFQSRFGSEEWLTPYTDDYVEQLVESGKKRVAVYCPSFVADCLETIDEIGHELQEEVKDKDGEILFIPSLNTRDQWCEDFAHLIKNTCEGTREDRSKDYYELDEEEVKQIKPPEYESTPLSPRAKSSLSIVFLVLFLDLVGFSIIFPLFPALATYYLETDPDNYFLRLIFDSIHALFGHSGGEALSMSSIVLFGGALGALYSFLQFFAAPFWGGISDRIGRRPVLLITVFGLAFSYLLWGIAGSFTTLIIARFLGGVMSGNISTASAVVADVTTRNNRSKGMATIGIAFALGFIIGPAVGGIFSLINLLDYYPTLERFGINPFSLPAFFAFLLSMINFYLVWTKFDETLPKDSSGVQSDAEDRPQRIVNPIKLFRPLPYVGVNFTNISNFLFILAFSGMEFTLTFLAVERLSYGPFDNAKMFIFIGIIITLVQGGYVRRKANQVGEKLMSLRGMATIIPGLLIISYSQNTFILYLGLFFLAVGSSMVIPCLTSLVSLYTPPQVQGQAIGVFRSLGALGRVIGPLVASVLYWKYGSAVPYLVGSAFLLIPLLLISSLPNPSKDEVLLKKG